MLKDLVSRSVRQKFTRAALVLTLAVGTTGCRSEEVAIGLGAGAIGVIVGSELSRPRYPDRYDRYDRYDSYRPRCQSGYREVCHDYYDRWGDYRRQCRTHYDRCYYYNSAVQQDGVPTPPRVRAVPDAAGLMAQSYKVSYEAASRFVAAMRKAANGDATAVREIGLEDGDLLRLASFEMISDEGVTRVADSLQTTESNIRELVLRITSEVRAQAKDVESPLWKSCLAKGEWRTPENPVCRETFWSGCSPATGATLCSAAS